MAFDLSVKLGKETGRLLIGLSVETSYKTRVQRNESFYCQISRVATPLEK